MTCGRAVLVVDDDADIRETISDVLADKGYHPLTASNGDEALRVLDGGEHPCVIFLDMMMPVMSGAEFLEVIEERGSAGQIPVVVVSAHVDSVEGVADVLRKPFSVDRLEQLAARYC